MEDWSFPPSYDENYFPDAASRYWFPERETMPAAAREAAHSRTPADRSAPTPTSTRPSTGANGTRPGFHPSQLKSLEDFENEGPRRAKEGSARRAGAQPPFGDYLCVPESEIFHIHGTSGTTGRPDGVRHRPQRLARNRQCARPDHVGHGPAAGRHDLRRRDLLASIWEAGARSPAPSGSARKAFPFGAGVAGHVGALRAVARS